MNTVYKAIGVLLVLALAFAAGAFYGRGQRSVQVQTIEKIVTVQGEERIVYRDRAIVVEKVKIVKADGTTIEKEITKTEEKSGEQTKSETKVATETSKQETKKAQARYAILAGLARELPPYPAGTYKEGNSYYGGGSARVVGPIWIDGTYTPSTKDITLGLRLEF